MSVVLDTNASIYQLSGRLDVSLGKKNYAVSVITQIESFSRFPA